MMLRHNIGSVGMKSIIRVADGVETGQEAYLQKRIETELEGQWTYDDAQTTKRTDV